MGAWTATWLFPAICRPCGDPGMRDMDLCPACYRELPRNACACLRCAEPLPARGLLCGRCLRDPPAFDSVCAPWLYAPPLDWLIQELKFGGRIASGRLLGQLLARRLQRRTPAVDLVVPMPLHDARLRERGFNQATELARPVATSLGLPLDCTSLIRVRPTARQAGLPLARRAGNVRRAFAVRRPLDGLRLAVVDDVLTTASTARSVATALKEAGAARVEIWAVARAGRDGGPRAPGHHTHAHAADGGSG
ncbi:MAG: ComF family protein [Ectothiorhodospiraceae bacterium]|nr:ComF family protein [Ectothiorhodospiraceae bacterium]